jgi:hypothetical protein
MNSRAAKQRKEPQPGRGAFPSSESSESFQPKEQFVLI